MGVMGGPYIVGLTLAVNLGGRVWATLKLVRMGDRNDRPYYTTNRLVKPVYSRGNPSQEFAGRE